MEDKTVLLLERKQRERNIPGAGIAFRGMPAVPSSNRSHFLKIAELSKLASPAGDQVAFFITKYPREGLGIKIYFSL